MIKAIRDFALVKDILDQATDILRDKVPMIMIETSWVSIRARSFEPSNAKDSILDFNNSYLPANPLDIIRSQSREKVRNIVPYARTKISSIDKISKVQKLEISTEILENIEKYRKYREISGISGISGISKNDNIAEISRILSIFLSLVPCSCILYPSQGL